MLSQELEADIVRLYHAEKWKVGTIARQLGVHHSAVRRVLSQQGVSQARRCTRASITDPFIPLIVKTLEKYPRLPASRLWQMAKERGYPGARDYFRTVVARYRPRPKAEAYLRLRTLAAEQAQVDWGHFGHQQIGNARRPLMAFVMVLSYSRAIFLRFYLSAKMPCFLHGHVSAFEHFGGVARVLLYDNLKSAVLERKGDAIRFHPTLLELSAHYRFEPRPCAPYRGNEKGRVERAIRYIRSSFFAGREFRDLEDLNQQAFEWSQGYAAERRCPEDEALTVREAFEQERSKLLELPDDAFAVDERLEVTSSKLPYLRFDLNDYSIPADRVRKPLVLLASLTQVRILDGSEVVAEHSRCFERRRVIEDPAHIRELVEHKRKARMHRGLDRLQKAVPASAPLFEALAEQGVNLGAATTALLRQLDRVGAADLEHAITEALQRGTPHIASVRQVLETQRYSRGLPPTVGRHLPQDERVQGPVVKPHSLGDYDAIGREGDDG